MSLDELKVIKSLKISDTNMAGADKPGSGLKHHSGIPGDKGVVKMTSRVLLQINFLFSIVLSEGEEKKKEKKSKT